MRLRCKPTSFLAALLTCAMLLLPAAALAHATVVATTPGKGASVKAPKLVTVTLSGPLRSGTLTVTGPKGVSATKAKGGRDPRNVKRLAVALKSGLAAGRYTARASWVAADGHRQSYVFTFQVRA